MKEVDKKAELMFFLLVASELSAEEVTFLSNAVKKRNKDLSLRIRLIGHFLRSDIHKNALIELLEPFIIQDPRNPIHEHIKPSFYMQEIKNAWLQQIEERPQDVSILDNAAEQMSLCDSQFAEQLWRRLQNLDPENDKWPLKLSDLYLLMSLDEKGLPEQAYVDKALAYGELALRLHSANHKCYLTNHKWIVKENLIALALQYSRPQRAADLNTL